MDRKPTDRYLERKQPLIRPHRELRTTYSGQASIINPTIVQPAPALFMNDMISSRQHEPNQVTQPIFSQQPSLQHGYQQTVHQNLPAFVAFKTCYTLGAVQLDNNEQKISNILRKSVPIVKPFVFDGKPEQWLDWIGLFIATIDNTDLSHSEKVTRRYGCKGLLYSSALQRLENDFGNPT